MSFPNTDFIKTDFEVSNSFQKKFDNDIQIISVTNSKNLSDIFLESYNKKTKLNVDLESISSSHNQLGDNLKQYDPKFGINDLTTFFYDMPNSFNIEYINLLKNDLRKKVNENFFFQKNPTIRVQVPHKSSTVLYPFYHSDFQLGHPPYEINLWMPLTKPSKTEGHGFKILNLDESKKIFHDYDFDPNLIKENRNDISEKINDHASLQKFDFGNAVMFDSRCLHSTIPLLNHTRVSLDIRIVTVRDFEEFNHTYKGTGRREVLYTPGSGYSELSIDEA